MRTFKEFIAEGNKGSAFANTMKLSYKTVEKIAKGFGGFHNDKGIWTITNNENKHVMTYNLKEGELYTDFTVEQIEKMAERTK